MGEPASGARLGTWRYAGTARQIGEASMAGSSPPCASQSSRCRRQAPELAVSQQARDAAVPLLREVEP